METKRISEFTSNDNVEGFYLLQRVEVKKTKNGAAYVDATLTDKTGSINAKLWDLQKNSGIPAGEIVKVRGSVSEYNGALQLTIAQIRLACEEDGIMTEDILPSAPIDIDEVKNYFGLFCDSITDSDYKRLVTAALEKYNDAFFNIPAAKAIHHAFLHGLAMHTRNMLGLAVAASELYGDFIDTNLLFSGIILHDIGKIAEMCFNKYGLATEYSVEGNLLGHLVIGALEVQSLCAELDIPAEKALLLQHMLISHHGEPEFGAAKRPAIAEAELLHHIDMIDSRMEIYREALEKINQNQMSTNIFALQTRIFKHR